MIGVPLGMAAPKLVSVKLQPMPRITSAVSRKWRTGFGTARPPEPRAGGWSSGHAILPPGPARERTVLRKRALAAEARGHRRAEQFRERTQFAPRARPMHALAGIDD